MAARIQLTGCHIQYESDQYDNSTPEDELTHKTCSEPQGLIPEGQFGELRSQAFATLETEMANDLDNGVGFYSIKHGVFHAMAQCEVGVRACECIQCVVDGVHVIEQECDNSFVGQVYMSSCSLSFQFDPHGSDFDTGKKNHLNCTSVI